MSNSIRGIVDEFKLVDFDMCQKFVSHLFNCNCTTLSQMVAVTNYFRTTDNSDDRVSDIIP